MKKTDKDLEAAEWVITLEDEDLSLEDWDAFEAWLDDSPNNLLAYEAARRDWSLALALPMAHGGSSPTPPPLATAVVTRVACSHVPRSSWRRPAVVFGGVGVGVVLVSFLVIMIRTLVFPADTTPQQIYQTTVGALRTVDLADGSQLQLNSGSEVRARLGVDSRHFEIVHGEAIFKVSSDPRRPFAVTAGAETLWALGTRFSVRLRETGSVEVIVAEGRVGFDCRPAIKSNTPATRPACATELTEGDRAIIGSGQWVKEKLSTQELQDRLGWTRGFLELNGRPLSELIEELNRYISVRIEIADPRLADVRLSGRVKIGSTDAVVTAILNTACARRDPSGKDPKVIQLISGCP